MLLRIIFISVFSIFTAALLFVLLKARRSKKSEQTKSSINAAYLLPKVEEFSGDNCRDTELDLARAYIELRHHEKAKGLLKSVITQGDPEQITEARKMFTLLLKQEREDKQKATQA